ncbi:hypothetical protein FKM82_004577 [Ascaphus truei]
MSEKLRRCRKELSAAIDRALECTVLPTLVQVQNASGSLRHTWQRSPTNLRHVGYRRIPFGDSSSLNQPMENIQPAPVTGQGPENNRSRTSFKRRPFSSRENLLKRPYNSNHTGKSARRKHESPHARGADADVGLRSGAERRKLPVPENSPPGGRHVSTPGRRRPSQRGGAGAPVTQRGRHDHRDGFGSRAGLRPAELRGPQPHGSVDVMGPRKATLVLRAAGFH